MEISLTWLASLMKQAVQFSRDHVAAGGLPFVGVVITTEGYVSDFGVNEVRETGDPTAHAEIVAMRTAMRDLGRVDLKGAWLLATGAPCGLCYSFAVDHHIAEIVTAVDSDTVAEHGFDYRNSYAAYGMEHAHLHQATRCIPVLHCLQPFELYRRIWCDDERPPDSLTYDPKGTP